MACSLKLPQICAKYKHFEADRRHLLKCAWEFRNTNERNEVQVNMHVDRKW
jgi:hypothetical protein